ncbi:growth/differentiation factor 10-like [Asterias rubens]|uniref:growth/differentiation factor 10-like n=1 Tax=Asterias rubens TaxID=7604 RepID=UPI001455AAE8|nr:growth/differentiation factor 10-like [Asterias rubens]
MAGSSSRYVAKVFIISCIGVMLCSGLPSTKPAKHVDSSSWFELPGESPTGMDPVIDGAVHPPKHIMKIMKKLTVNHELLRGRGNTVRSVLPRHELACSELMYVFTVRPHTSEDFKAAELQYFASKQLTTMDSNSVLSIQVHLIEDTPTRCRLMGIHRQPSPGRRWRTLDITSHLVHIMNATKSTTSKLVIGVSFKVLAGSHNTPHDRDVIERVISNHARPFLLMYALEDESNDKNSALPWAKEEARKLHYEQTVHSRHARSIDTKTYPILTNEFPEDGKTNLAHQATFQHFTEQDSNRRKEKKRTGKKRKGHSKKRGKAPLLDPTSSLSDDVKEPVLNGDDAMNTVNPSNGVCSRHPMFVNFSTMNWDRYVIAPSGGFEAYYCAGSCSFPLSKTSNPSNHAHIQSVMSAVTSQDIPPPCCVPQSMSPLSILYFNEENDVALKTYQNMVVESCGCR